MLKIENKRNKNILKYCEIYKTINYVDKFKI